MKNTTVKILVILLAFTLFSCKDSKPETAIGGKTKKEVVSFSPKLSGRILKIYVEEGQTVKTGDTLAILDVPEVSAKIAQAKGATSSAAAQVQMARNGATENQLNQLKAKQKGLQEQFNFAQKSFNRAKNMYNDELLSPQNYDEYFAKYQGAKAQLDAVNAELRDVQMGTRVEKIEMAQGQENQARGALQEANVAYSERYIIATNDMEIETIALNKGELATAGYPLFTGYIPSSSYFRFTIPETKIAKYQKGMQVRLVVNYSKKEITGKIVAIKQLAKYADITSAFPDYEPEEAIYEIKVVPENQNLAKDILVNSNVTLQ